MYSDVETLLDIDNAVIITIVIIVISVLGTLIKKLYRKNQKGIRGVDILQALQNAKLFPIDCGSTWSLHNCGRDTRIWKGELTSDVLSPTAVYGCYSKVKGSSQVVLKTLQDLQKYPTWWPRLSHVHQITRAQETPSSQSKSKNSPGLPVQHDYVSLETDHTPSSLVTFINQLSLYLQAEPLIRKIIKLHRYWHREDNGCCWLLETNEAEAEWTFYLAQPVEEMDQCLLSIVHCPADRENEWLVASRLGALQNYFLYRKIQCTPLVTVSLPTATPRAEHVPQSLDIPTIPPPTNGKQTEDSLPNSPTKAESPKTEANILQRFKNLIEEKKEWYEERKRRGSVNSLGGEVGSQERKNSLEKDQLKRLPLADEMGEIEVDGGGDGLLEAAGTKAMKLSSTAEINNGELPTPDKERSSILKFLRSSPTNEAKSIVSDEKKKLRSGLSLSLMQKIKGLDQTSNKTDEQPDEVLGEEAEEEENETEEERLLSGFRTIANSTAAEIMAEKVKVSNIDISKSFDDQATQTGGWIYCGLEKDVVILRKIVEDGSPVQSYLGKGVIPAAPKAVFEALKNPRTRFTYDEMLKKVDIVHDFCSGMKIVYLYHEVSQLFRKEARDFCLLQSERIEGFKYVISLRSVGWPDCTENDDVTRGKFHASGWIIEPTNRDNKLYTMVTYIVQMELGMSKTNTGYLVEELAAKQPLSIAHLRQYLAPSVTQRSQSTSSPASKTPPTAPMGTLAAAAAFASKGAALQNSSSLD